MVILITMKNVILRSGKYHFRIRVPKDCQESVGKREITQSLKTKEAVEAFRLAKGLTDDWKKKFEEIRNPVSSPALAIQSKTNETVDDFRKTLFDYMNQNLPALLDKKSKAELYELSELYREWMVSVLDEEGSWSLDLSEELGIRLPLSKNHSPGMTRKLNRVVVDALGYIRSTIDDEYGEKISQKIDEDLLGSDARRIAPKETPAHAPTSPDETDIIVIANLMFDAKNKDGKFRDLVLGEIGHLQEWLGGKSDLTAFSKSDLVDYIQNCLPYFPKRMRHTTKYDGKPLRKCVELVRKNPAKYVPISYITCENRLIGIQTVFNYAKDQLGIIRINPANGIQIPKIRMMESKERGFTADELPDMWTALKQILACTKTSSERYWVPILGLYHGLRLNEICCLQNKDVYRDKDGVFVMDINDKGRNKSVKNKSSIRVVPVHPFVLEDLKFQNYVEDRNSSASENDRLFPNLTYTDSHGYGKKISVWFAKWKKTWLPEKSYRKNFHDLRYTFAQQAQNQAKMSDRCSQEITGHSISGMSSVHLGYSGRLKPKDVLEELKKIQYGWE